MGIFTSDRPAAELVWQPAAACLFCDQLITQTTTDGPWRTLRVLPADPAVYCVHDPGGDPVEPAPGYAMDDPSFAGEHAYGATFYLEAVPGASITIWAYPIGAPPDMPGCYQIGYRCEYRYETGGDHEPWVLPAYSEDPEFYDDLSRCDETARETAQIMARTRRDGPQDSPAEDWELFLDWDGVPA